jgi:hypothetical protein
MIDLNEIKELVNVSLNGLMHTELLDYTINLRTIIRDFLPIIAEYDKQIEDGTIINLNNISEDVRIKIRETVQRIEKEGSGGLICILL